MVENLTNKLHKCREYLLLLPEIKTKYKYNV